MYLMEREENILQQPSVSPRTATNWVDLLRLRAQERPEQIVYNFLGFEEGSDATITFGELDRRARVIAAQLQNLGMANERAIVIYPPGIDYICAFWGCIYAGVTAVPVYPPRARRNLSLQRLQGIIADAQPRLGLTNPDLLAILKGSIKEAPLVAQLHYLTWHDDTHGIEDLWQEPENTSDTLAYLQYTSGSTGSPKGVMISHGNLLHNAGLSRENFGFDQNTHMVSWVPPYHDLGLVLTITQPIFTGFPLTFMAPFAFVYQPLRWLHAISTVKGTATSAPNFAYELCANKVTADDLATLDLRSLIWAANIAEPVRPRTIDHFTSTFAQCGFRREAFYPSYGLAESTLFATGGSLTAPPLYSTFSKSALTHGQIRPASGEPDDAYTLVGCGQALGGQRVLIVDPETHLERPPEHIGEIWISGPSVARGYWQKAQETSETFGMHLANEPESLFLRTGDLGFIKDGEFYINGRRKDLIIIDGRNYYPQDIELDAESSHSAIRPGLCVAFSIEQDEQERLVVLAEIKQEYYPAHETGRQGIPLEPDEVIRAIRQSISANYEVHVDNVVLLKPFGIQKTSSGKVKRRNCRADYLSGQMEGWLWSSPTKHVHQSERI